MSIPCKAYTRGQTNYCDRCGIQWDINDSTGVRCLTPYEKFKLDMRKLGFRI